MKAEAFEELLTSVRQLGAIRRSERKPSRSRTFKPTDVKAVRADLGQSQVEFALMIGVRRLDAAELGTRAQDARWTGPRPVAGGRPQSRGRR